MTSETAKKIKSKDTKIEQTLAKAMWSAGLRYRKNVRSVHGVPDFVFKSKKIAIFCDSEFWHGKKFSEGEQFKTNTDFWEDKIKKNIQRDSNVNQTLKAEGWIIIRFWGKEIEKNSQECVQKVISIYKGINVN